MGQAYRCVLNTGIRKGIESLERSPRGILVLRGLESGKELKVASFFIYLHPTFNLLESGKELKVLSTLLLTSKSFISLESGKELKVFFGGFG